MTSHRCSCTDDPARGADSSGRRHIVSRQISARGMVVGVNDVADDTSLRLSFKSVSIKRQAKCSGVDLVFGFLYAAAEGSC